MSQNIRVICLGDVVGRPGREAIEEILPELQQKLNPDLIIANGENAAGGAGIDPGTADELKAAGVNVITLGDHTYQRKQAHDYLDRHKSWCIRPANYPEGAPGLGSCIYTMKNGKKIGVMNLQGRVFMNANMDCPYTKAKQILNHELKGCDVVICDFHAEATSEKGVMFAILDGKVGLVYGTHTHVQTADEQISKLGTAFISDIGMCGCCDGILGMSKDVAVKRLTTGLPHAYEVAEGRISINGIIVEFDSSSGKALNIERLRVVGS